MNIFLNKSSLQVGKLSILCSSIVSISDISSIRNFLIQKAHYILQNVLTFITVSSPQNQNQVFQTPNAFFFFYYGQFSYNLYFKGTNLFQCSWYIRGNLSMTQQSYTCLCPILFMRNISQHIRLHPTETSTETHKSHRSQRPTEPSALPAWDEPPPSTDGSTPCPPITVFLLPLHSNSSCQWALLQVNYMPFSGYSAIFSILHIS